MEETQAFLLMRWDGMGIDLKRLRLIGLKLSRGKRDRSHYTTNEMIQQEIRLFKGGRDNQIYVLFLGGLGSIDGASGVCQPLCQVVHENCNYLVIIPIKALHTIRPILAHEIAHAYGLDHAPLKIPEWIVDNGKQRLETMDVMIFPLPVPPRAFRYTMMLNEFRFNAVDAGHLNKTGRLSVDVETLDISFYQQSTLMWGDLK